MISAGPRRSTACLTVTSTPSVRAHFAGSDTANVNSGTGAQGIKHGSKMFVMFHKGQLLVQLPPERVAELIASGEGLAHDPGTGKPMKNRVLIPDTDASTGSSCVRSRFVTSRGPSSRTLTRSAWRRVCA